MTVERFIVLAFTAEGVERLKGEAHVAWSVEKPGWKPTWPRLVKDDLVLDPYTRDARTEVASRTERTLLSTE